MDTLFFVLMCFGRSGEIIYVSLFCWCPEKDWITFVGVLRGLLNDKREIETNFASLIDTKIRDVLLPV